MFGICGALRGQAVGRIQGKINFKDVGQSLP
jgi:hypothetical protein